MQQSLFSSYYNTVPLSGTELSNAANVAAAQEQIIHNLFTHYNQLSPSQAERILKQQGREWPITSIRRAITNLTKDGILRKADVKVMGVYGHKENVWQLNKN